MKFGIALPHFGREIRVAELLEEAREAERLGFASLWATDHLIVPTRLDLPYRDHMLEPLSLLSYLAGVTSRAALGSSVIIVPYRNPIALAKMLATIDHLSGGRLVFGAGVGWMEGEFEALGVPFRSRGEIADEYLRIVFELWRRERPTFDGKYYRFRDVTFSPLPLQRPRPAVWIGGASRRALRRAVEFGDAWHPVGLGPEEIAQGRAYMEKVASARGAPRIPAQTLRVSLSIEGVSVPLGAERPSRAALRGGVEAIREQIAAYRAVGVEHLVLDVSSLTHASLLKTIETFATKLAGE